MTSFEAENTCILKYRTRDNPKVLTGKVIPLPKKVIFIHDTKHHYAQITVIPKKEGDYDCLKDLDPLLFYLVITNDPYASPAHPIINLGYSSVRFGLAPGEMKIGKNVQYTALNTNKVDFDVNIPLKGVNFMGEEKNWIFENKQVPTESYQIMEIDFKGSIADDIFVKNTHFKYDKNTGAFINYRTNLESIYNGHTQFDFKTMKNIDELIKYHYSSP